MPRPMCRHVLQLAFFSGHPGRSHHCVLLSHHCVLLRAHHRRGSGLRQRLPLLAMQMVVIEACCSYACRVLFWHAGWFSGIPLFFSALHSEQQEPFV